MKSPLLTISAALGITLAVGAHGRLGGRSVALAEESAPSLASVAPATVLATVNSTSITAADLSQELTRPDLKTAVEALHDQPAELDKLKKNVLTSMIDKELLITAAKGSGTYKPDEIKKEVNEIIQEQGGQEVIQPILSSYGTSWDGFMRDMNERLTIEKFIEQDLLSKITISDEELKAAFAANPALYAEPETVTARHILVLVKPNASKSEEDAALTRLKEIQKRVTAPGADFGKIASETTDDTASKSGGGSLGAFQRGMMVPEFEKAAFELKVGEISQPIKTNYGYHLIKVEDHKQGEAPTFEKAKDRVRYQVMSKTHDRVLTDKIAQLRSAAKIDSKVLGLAK